MTEITTTPEEYQKAISTLARLLLEQMDTTKSLIELLSPEAKEALVKIGKLAEKPSPLPRNVV